MGLWDCSLRIYERMASDFLPNKNRDRSRRRHCAARNFGRGALGYIEAYSCGVIAGCMPWASKTNVLASDSAPWGGSSSPFQRKLTPAALPTLTTSSCVAWKLVAAGAIRVSCVTSCPSEVTEIQEFALARTTSVNFVPDCPDGLAALAPKERIVTSPFFWTFTALGSVSAAVAGAGAGAPLGGSVLAVGWTDAVEVFVIGAGVVTGGVAGVAGGAI